MIFGNEYRKLPPHLKVIADEAYIVEKLKGTKAQRLFKVRLNADGTVTKFRMSEEMYKDYFLDCQAIILLTEYPPNKPSYRNTLGRKERRY